MLIDTTYFVGEILIPGLTGDNFVVTGNVEEVTRFIKKYEKDYLLHVLGEDLYKAFMDGLAEDVVDPKWTDLRDKLIDTEVKTSPIADYTYYHIKCDRITSSTELGEVEAAAENSIPALNTNKMARAYNNAVRYGKVLRSWLNDHIETYAEFATAGSYKLSPVNTFGI